MGLRQCALEDLEMSDHTRPDSSFWRGRRVLLTGHTGFKGAWLALWLHRMGAHVTGIGLAPATTPNLYSEAGVDKAVASHFCDIRNAPALAELVQAAKPEIVFHLAAQAIVRASYERPTDTFATNVVGTAHVLDALRGLASVRAAVVITTDKVYRNLEQPYPYREDDPLGGHDPYSASKAASELVVASYRDAFLETQGIAVATARAGNVIGGGDWSPDRLIPDAVRAWSAGAPLKIRRPDAVRPWQHVLDPLAGYLVLAEKLCNQPGLAGAWNFGPLTHEAATVRSVVEMARSLWPGGVVEFGDGSEGPHEAGWLALEIAKARSLIGVTPKWPLGQGVPRTLRWYRRHQEGAGARSLCEAEIADYESQI